MKRSVRYLIQTLLIGCFAFASPCADAHRQLRVLVIGNSFSIDAFAYLPHLMEELAPDVELTMAIAYHGGYTLQHHWERGVLEKNVYNHYYKYTRSTGCWREDIKPWSFGLKYVVKNEPWDIIVLHEGSAHSRDYSLYQPYLNNLVGWLRERAAQPFELVWMMPPAYPDGSQYAETTSRAMMADIMSATRRVMDETDATLLLPCGAALENARTTELDSVGKFGHLSYDGLHLHEGIASLTECYAAAIALLEHLGIDYDLRADTLPVDRTWLTSTGKPSYRGEPSGLDIAGARPLAMRCALRAVRNPYEVTDMSAAPVDEELADTCYVADVDMFDGEAESVPLMLFNTVPILALEADLSLPGGLSALRDGQNRLMQPTERSSGAGQTVSMRWVRNNLFHISLTASAATPFEANSEAIARFCLMTKPGYSDKMKMKLSNIVMTDIFGNVHHQDGGKTSVSIYRCEDVNRDGHIDIADLNLMVSASLGFNSPDLWHRAADINRDGHIDVADVNYLVNHILKDY